MSLLTTIPNIITSAVAVDANEDFTILWILLSGILVFFMQAGFTLVESGLTRAKNAGNIAMKNFMDIITWWRKGRMAACSARPGTTGRLASPRVS